MYQKSKDTHFKIDYYVFTVQNREDKDAIWTRIGIASRAKSGEDVINIKLNALPVNGRLTLLRPSERGEQETPEAEA